jgi:hypothetical protein
MAIVVTGPSTIAPGALAQFRAVMTFDDGTTVDVSGGAAWRSSSTSLAIAAGGGATAADPGEAIVLASVEVGPEPPNHQQLTSAPVHVLILEPGTHRLTGTVSAGGLPVVGALIQVAAGVGQGLQAITSATGTYAIYGIAADVTIRVSAAGFDPLERTLTATKATVADFDLSVTKTK